MPEMCTRIKAGVTPGTGKMAIWENPAAGDVMAPYDDPLANWDLVRFHSDFQYLNNAIEVSGISVNHSLVAGVSGSGYAPPSAGGGSTGPIASGQVVVSNKTVYTHSLGYVPWFQLRFAGRVVSPGTVVQQATSQIRFVAPYATSSIIGLVDIGISSSADLAAQTSSYDLTIFRETAEIPGDPLAHLRVDGNPITIGYGRVTSEQRPLRRAVSGDTSFFIPYGRSMDIRNGAVRFINDTDEFDIGTYIGAFTTAEVIEVAF